MDTLELKMDLRGKVDNYKTKWPVYFILYVTHLMIDTCLYTLYYHFISSAPSNSDLTNYIQK